MVRSLIKLALLLVVCILVYNRFFGSDEEKQNSKKIFGEMRKVAVSVGDMIKSERQKFDAGKYDGALEKLGGAYKAVRDKAKYLDEKMLKRLGELETRKAQLEQELGNINTSDQQALTTPAQPKKGIKTDPKLEQAKAAKAADLDRRKEKLMRELESLANDSDQLLQQAQQKQE